MKAYISHFPRLFTATLLTLLTSPLCLAQVPVVDAAGSGNTPAAPAQNNNSELILTLYNQIEQLQREVANLRGMVEEQSFQIRRMQTEQRDRYIDVDQRLTELSMGSQAAQGMPANGAAAGNPTQVNAGNVGNANAAGQPAFTGPGNVSGATTATGPGAGQVNTPATNNTAGLPGSGRAAGTAVTSPAVNTGLSGSQEQPGNTAAQGTAAMPVPTAQNEQEIYQTALNLLLNESRTEEAIAAFGRYIDAYPNGQLLANAFYWQGEALILEERYAQAESVFRKVIDDYPAHGKAPDSLLKLGMVYERAGNDERAREAWESISVRYPQSTNIIRLAEDNLSRL